MYRAFRMYDLPKDNGFSFPHFILVIDSIIGFNHPTIRMTFTQRFFGLHEISSISTIHLKECYDSAKIFSSAPQFFTPLEFAGGRGRQGFETAGMTEEQSR